VIHQILIATAIFVSSLVYWQTGTIRTVSSDEAKTHCIQRIEPSIPPIAKAVRVGGKVKLHITISRTGTVTGATVLSGPPVLVQSAIDAVKQWKYKPFFEGDAPVEVVVDVEVDFPGGMPESESGTRQKYSPMVDECRRLISDRKYIDAEDQCRKAVQISDELPKDVILERSNARSLLAIALYLQQRFEEAIPIFEEALKLDKGYLKPNDADLASDYANLARALAAIGDLSKADEMYGVAVSTFRAAIRNLPDMSEKYSRRLKKALNEYADLKDAEGQADAASELRKQATELKTD
jgi:TonB family protein